MLTGDDVQGSLGQYALGDLVSKAQHDDAALQRLLSLSLVSFQPEFGALANKAMSSSACLAQNLSCFLAGSTDSWPRRAVGRGQDHLGWLLRHGA